MTISTTGGRRPMGPPLAQQLRDAGFDAIAKHDETGQIVNGIRDGSETAWIEPHGAAQEPFPTFSHFHSKFSAPIGQTTGYRRANSRYEIRVRHDLRRHGGYVANRLMIPNMSSSASGG
ncbi:MAG: hypothetical protein R2932_11060 [Caldilineaceae bacterium]